MKTTRNSSSSFELRSRSDPSLCAPAYGLSRGSSDQNTQADEWRYVVVVCSPEGTLIKSDSALSSVGGIVGGVLRMLNGEQALLNTTEVTRQQCSVS